jgi:hypothetical protein
MTALRAFLLGVLSSTVEVVQGQVNRVPEPIGTDFVVMTDIRSQRLAWNIETFQNATQTLDHLEPVQLTIQLDIHGPNGADNTRIIEMLFRSPYGCDQFPAGIQPLYTADPIQTPYENGEQQIEQRWTLDVLLQYNPVVTTSMQSATSLDLGIVDVDATIPA